MWRYTTEVVVYRLQAQTLPSPQMTCSTSLSANTDCWYGAYLCRSLPWHQWTKNPHWHARSVTDDLTAFPAQRKAHTTVHSWFTSHTNLSAHLQIDRFEDLQMRWHTHTHTHILNTYLQIPVHIDKPQNTFRDSFTHLQIGLRIHRLRLHNSLLR